MNRIKIVVILLAIVLMWSCNVTKHVPEGQHLLHKVHIQNDVKDIPVSELDDYLRQTPNSKVFGLFKMQLGIYNLAGKDTTRKINRLFMRLGDAPVLYDESQTTISAQQLQKVMVHYLLYLSMVL